MRKSCKRVVRNPNWVEQRTVLADDQVRDLGLAYRMALEAMLKGHGSVGSWSTLACSLNTGVMLAELSVVSEAMDTLKAAQDALLSCRNAVATRGKYAFNGDESVAIKAAFLLHDKQVETATKRQITLSINEVYRRIESGEVS